MLLLRNFISLSIKSQLTFNSFSIKHTLSFSYFPRNMTHFNGMIAVAQMRATDDKERNFNILKNLAEKAASQGAKMLFLPEGCDYIAESKKSSLKLAEPLNGPTMRGYCHLAASLDIWLSIGGMHIKEDSSHKISNTHIIIDNSGNIVSKYAKIHLFSVKIPDQKLDLQESNYVLQGDSIVSPVLTPCGWVASGICYDLRFPEFSLLQRRSGAQILTFPSAFTVATGLAHWHTLLRARAIETQCYVVAAAQTGQHNSKRSSFGHALVVDPWGTVIAEVSEGSGIALAEIDSSYLEKVRREMPVEKHRRKDLYSLCHHPVSEPRLMELADFPKDFVLYPFGQVSLRGSHIFLQTALSHAFVNKKPFIPGHVLVTPQRPAERFLDLTEGEVSDLAQTIVAVLHVVTAAHRPDRVQVAFQDGTCAGQTINHVHAHVVPVREAERGFLEDHETKRVSNGWRNDGDMSREAAALRQHTHKFQQESLELSTTDLPSSLRFKKPSTRDDPFRLEDMTVPNDEIFLYTGRCFSFLPGNSILPGHVCVCPCNQVSSLTDLSPADVTDIFLSLQRIQGKIERYHGASSSTIFIRNDHKRKGLCAHILPRKPDDLEENDDLYKLLDNYVLSPPSNNAMFNQLKKDFNSE